MPSPSVHAVQAAFDAVEDAVQALFGTRVHRATNAKPIASTQEPPVQLPPCSTSFQAGADSTTEPMVPERGHPQFPDVGDPLKMKAELQRPILCLRVE